MEENDPEATKRREEKIVNSLCSFQSRLGPPEYRRWRRIHGLQLPLHPQQVMGWLVLLSVGAATFLVLIPSLSTSFRECLLIVLGVLFGIHIVSHVAALLLDPADPELRALKVKVAVPEFDRTKHAHVIENGRCHLCNIKTKGPRTKHCSVCNKCIDKFDHHCKWLNHCIGGRNYPAFLVCVITAVVASLLVVGVSVLEIIYYHTDPDLLSIFPERQNGTASVTYLPESVFLGVVSVLALLAATTAGLLLHLCLFHCYISLLGITTYEYIRNYRQGAIASTFFPYNFTCKKVEVMSNQMSSSDQLQNNRRSLKFENGCCYSRSRPPETGSGCCDDFRAKFKCSKSDERGSGKKVRKLERQDTDPEFIDRVVKPFVITLNDEKKTDAESVHFPIRARSYKCRGCSCLRSDADVESQNADKTHEPVSDPLQTVMQRTSSVSSNRSRKDFKKFWQLCSKSMGVPRNTDTIGKIKCNQIRPKAEEEINRALEKIAAIKSENKFEKLQIKLNTANKLPELNVTRKLQSPSELKELTTVLDLAEQPNFALQHSMRCNLRRGRKKVLTRRPRSPSLSPIRESGLSNPGSPRVTAISPLSTPIFTRTSSPEMSTIFLSNPNSPCSSEEDLSSSSPTPRWTKKTGGDVLETPQLPRKMYSSKQGPVFVVKPAKFRSNKWIDLEIRDGV
ncbi:UNVERIFIED_CONTAM: hypothetical protein PYX00_005257 [Menopon gallinae]|uniref:Palmitoyltransferase n=1 Tax=Menopon gallinae TaxID=328185 RepID=A0AAW2HQC6_9NEOP